MGKFRFWFGCWREVRGGRRSGRTEAPTSEAVLLFTSGGCGVGGAGRCAGGGLRRATGAAGYVSARVGGAGCGAPTRRPILAKTTAGTGTFSFPKAGAARRRKARGLGRAGSGIATRAAPICVR